MTEITDQHCWFIHFAGTGNYALAFTYYRIEFQEWTDIKPFSFNTQGTNYQNCRSSVFLSEPRAISSIFQYCFLI